VVPVEELGYEHCEIGNPCFWHFEFEMLQAVKFAYENAIEGMKNFCHELSSNIYLFGYYWNQTCVHVGGWGSVNVL